MDHQHHYFINIRWKTCTDWFEISYFSCTDSIFQVHFEFIMLLGFWLDGVDDVVEGLWKWASTDTNLTYTDWYPGQPSNGGSTHNEDCLHIYPGLNYHWNDIHCDYIEYFICEYM
jgi:hypothetical protein